MANINGTARADALTGDRRGVPEPDTIRGFGGDDSLDGVGGNDVLLGGDGSDEAYGGDGNDRIQGDNGDDELIGEAGNDILLGGSGNDYLEAALEQDLETNSNSLNGGAGSDELVGDIGIDRLIGGAGNDFLYAVGTSDFARLGRKPGTRRSEKAQAKLQQNAARRSPSTSRTGAPDELIGVDPNVANPGRGEIDELYGGGDVDRFVLGQGTKVYYNDGNRNTVGDRDYALIYDFEVGKDTLVLAGAATNYLFISNATEERIFFRGPATSRFPTAELIAIRVLGSSSGAARQTSILGSAEFVDLAIDTSTEI